MQLSHLALSLTRSTSQNFSHRPLSFIILNYKGNSHKNNQNSLQKYLFLSCCRRTTSTQRKVYVVIVSCILSPRHSKLFKNFTNMKWLKQQGIWHRERKRSARFNVQLKDEQGITIQSFFCTDNCTSNFQSFSFDTTEQTGHLTRWKDCHFLATIVFHFKCYIKYDFGV